MGTNHDESGPDQYRCPHQDRPEGEDCRCYDAGYGEGKSKVHLEVRGWRPGDHFAGCGCDVCLTTREVLGAVMEAMPGDALLMVVPADGGTSSVRAASSPGEPEDHSGSYQILHRWITPGPEEGA